VIVSVAMTVPRPGIFLDSVKYLLVVATPVDIVILAICSSDDTFNSVKIIPTAYTLPSDNITMIKIVGSELGRIFMIGNDRNLYELEYTITESPWAAIVGSQPTRKCRKVNHFAWNFKLNNLLPPIFRSNSNYLKDNLEDFSDLMMDNSRNILYSITNGGELNALFIPSAPKTGATSTTTTEFFLQGYNLFEECRRFASSARFTPQSSPNANVFHDTVSSDGFIPVALHPVSLTESKKCHLLVVLKNGIRIYLSLIGYRGIGSESSPKGIEIAYMRNPPSPEAIDQVSSMASGGATHSMNTNTGTTNNNPGQSSTTAAGSYSSSGFNTNQYNNDLENGSLPAINLSRQFSLGKAFVSRGVFLFSLEKSQQPDELYGIYEDLMRRDQSSSTTSSMNNTGGLNPYQANHAYCMKEGISLGLPSNVSGGKIHDVKEVSTNYLNYHFSKMKSLFYQSLSPSEMNIRDQTHHRWTVPTASNTNIGGSSSSWFGKTNEGGSGLDDGELSAVLTESNSLILRLLAKTAGIERHDMENMTILSELCAQHLPITSYFTQRQFLVLTSNGLQVLHKIRPADILFRCLIQHDSRTDEYVKEFFNYFGLLPSSLMCIGLAIGLPVDACGSKFTNPVENIEFAPTVPLKTIQIRAMRAMLALNNGPSYRTSISNTSTNTATGATNNTIQDNRLVVIGNTHEFSKSMIHDAFYWMTSRLLRMIWFRPVVDIQSDLLMSEIWSSSLIEQIRKPLEQLLELLVAYYPNALSSDLMASLAAVSGQQQQQQQTSSSSSSSAATTSGINLITHQLADQFHQQQRMMMNQNSANNNNPVVDDKSLKYQSKLLEDASIYNLILLIVRVLNTLSFIEVLQLSCQEYSIMKTFPSLKGFSFRSLVLLPNVQEIMRKQLTNILSILIQGNAGVESNQGSGSKMELANIILNKYEKECFFYYSLGDRYLISSKKLIYQIYHEGHALPDPMTGLFHRPEVMKMIEKCCDNYLKAVDYWNNNYDMILNLSNNNELKTACNSLLLLGKLGYETIVNLCLKMANKFASSPSSSNLMITDGRTGTTTTTTPSSKKTMNNDYLLTSGSTNTTAGDILSIVRDYNLFHGGVILSEAMKTEYTKLCYEILSDQIIFVDTYFKTVYDSHDLMKFPTNYTKQVSLLLLQYSLMKCNDVKFHEILYNKLYSMKLNDLLLSINSNYIENFLKEKNPELLYTYYMSSEYNRSPDYLKAIDLMCGLASESGDLSIQYRIQCIEKALTSAEFAFSSSSSNASNNKLSTPLKSAANNLPSNQSVESYLLDNIQQFKDMIEVASKSNCFHFIFLWNVC
jgi:hypothetical protein